MTVAEPRAPAWPVAAAAAVAILLFLPTVGYGFVYDDHRFVEANTALAEPSILWRAFADAATQTADGTHAGLWRPLRTLSFALDRLVFGAAPWGAHLVNVLLHGVGTAALVRLLQRLGVPALAAAFGGLVYAVHPVQVECVAWISSRGDLLSAACLWGALLLQRPGRAWGSWAFGCAALLAKEQAFVWPVLALLVARGVGERLSGALRHAILPAALSGVVWCVRLAAVTEPFQEGGLGPVSGVEIGRMLAHQTWFAFLPAGALFDWQMGAPHGAAARLVLGAVALAAVVVPLFLRPARLAGGWFLAALLPTLLVQLVVPLNIRVADRFLLFALPAVALLVGRAVARTRRCAPAAGLVVACLAVTTLTLQPAWASDDALWSRTVARAPGHWRARVWLGVSRLQAGDVEGAIGHLEEAVRLAPDDAKTRFRLAEALEKRAARTEGDAVVEATRAARDAYAAAVNRYPHGRQENRDLLEPLARVRAIDLTLALGDHDGAAVVLTGWLDRGQPPIPPGGAALWNRDLARLIDHVGEHLDPELERPLAPYLREWLIVP